MRPKKSLWWDNKIRAKGYYKARKVVFDETSSSRCYGSRAFRISSC